MTEFNGNISNANIDASAAIANSKLNLATITQSMIINSTLRIGDKLSFTQTDDNEYIDSLTDGELDIEATTSVNMRINAVEQVQFFNGKISPTTDDDIDLGDATHEFCIL